MTPQPLPVDELVGYRSHYNDLDADVAAANKCQICGTATEYRGFFHATHHSYRAFAVCLNPRCGHAQEF